MLPSYKSISLKSGASLAVLSLLICGGASASGLPSNGHFVSGQGQIGKAGQSLMVKQSSTTGIIEWNSFSIGRKNGVTFDNGTGATLNRVTGGNLSRIAGQLSATGTLYLMNSSGVIVSGTGHVVTGGNFVASSGNLADSAFNDGIRRFGNTSGKIVNRGSITAGGEAKLVGNSIVNTGTISATHVKLRATDGEALAAGTISATSNAQHDAHILVISDNGETNVTGTLNARNRDGSGGLIETSGHRVSIGGSIDAGKGGTWLVDPENLTINSNAATTIDDSLNAGTSVTLRTTATSTSGPGIVSAGPGNIDIDAQLSWNTAATLTLDAYRSVVVKSDVDITGNGGLAIITDDGGAKGTLSFMAGAGARFSNLASSLTINGANYILVSNIATLANDVAADDEREQVNNYALAKNYNAAKDGAYAGAAIAAEFAGSFEGLGHSISHLKLNSGSSKQLGVGLFAEIMPSGGVRDLALTKFRLNDPDGSQYDGAIAATSGGTIENVSVRGIMETGGGMLVGESGGVIENSHASGVIRGDGGTVGGLVASNSGTIIGSWSSVDVNLNGGGWIGGLVGQNLGIIEKSHATGNVKGGGVIGGFVGEDDSNGDQSLITNSYATGSVDADVGEIYDVGGFAGSDEGSTTNDHSTGNVMAKEAGDYPGANVGGFVGNGGEISDSYSTGNVIDYGENTGSAVGGFVGLDGNTITSSYSTGNVTASQASEVGGFAGLGGDTTNSYETGDVSVAGATFIGGFVGEISEYNSGIKNSYSFGKITNTNGNRSAVGGFAGFVQRGGEKGNTNCYWDIDTAGVSRSAAGKRISTSQLQSGLPTGFDSSIWAENPSINGGLPYLIALASSN